MNLIPSCYVLNFLTFANIALTLQCTLLDKKNEASGRIFSLTEHQCFIPPWKTVSFFIDMDYKSHKHINDIDVQLNMKNITQLKRLVCYTSSYDKGFDFAHKNQFVFGLK